MAQGFPYRNEIYNDNDRYEKFKELQKMDLRVYRSKESKTFIRNISLPPCYFKMNDVYEYLMYDPSKYEYYMLSDLFNDECRANCSFGSHISPLKYYSDNRSFIIQQLEKKKLDITPLNVREEIYKNHVECSIHNPLIIKHFIKKYNARNVCDISSGWGDRLIGALLSDVDNYFGVDPNPCLHKNYNKIIKMFRPLTHSKGSYKIIEGKFEDVELPDIKFDLMYTSPPYFDYEKYEGSTANVDFTKSEDHWLKTFLYPSIEKILLKLSNGGHLVFYFSQEKGKGYIEKWMKYMQSHSELCYVGNIFYCDLFFKGIHPIFIFKYDISRPLCNNNCQQ